VNEGEHGGCIFLFIYENRRMKSIEIVLRRGRGTTNNDGGVNLIKIYCKHICKCHNVSACATIIC
jgi:hypothetical protein